jgi:hypothetical protein
LHDAAEAWDYEDKDVQNGLGRMHRERDPNLSHACVQCDDLDMMYATRCLDGVRRFRFGQVWDPRAMYDGRTK